MFEKTQQKLIKNSEMKLKHIKIQKNFISTLENQS